MLNALYRIEMFITERTDNLKDRRKVLSSMRTKLGKFNASIRFEEEGSTLRNATLWVSYLAMRNSELDSFDSQLKEELYKYPVEIRAVKRDIV